MDQQTLISGKMLGVGSIERLVPDKRLGNAYGSGMRAQDARLSWHVNQ